MEVEVKEVKEDLDVDVDVDGGEEEDGASTIFKMAAH